ncbi:MAG: hypothetical protein HY711_03325 [Candidatus Melainabacteria bacterium]|nr:hypothetical protein [Candidatus Melainabacteria bacterium]
MDLIIKGSTYTIAPTGNVTKLLVHNSLLGYLKIPREHGAVVSFVLSTLLALKLAWPISAELTSILAAIWIVFFLQHRPRLALYVGLFSAVVLSVLCKSVFVVVLIGSFATGGRVLSYLSMKLGASWRETLGMLGLGIVPLVAATTITGQHEEGQVIMLAYAAASVIATSMIHILRRDPKRTWLPPVWVAGVLLVWLCAAEPSVLAICLTPFLIQLLWLIRKQKPSFAELGVIETVSMTWVFYLLWLHI